MNAAARIAVAKCDKCDADILLDLLASGELVTFQTFDDAKRNRRGLTRILHGSLAEHRQTLASLNERGAGVFWMVNAGDGKGRKATNVQRIRALFVDLDGAPLEPVKAATLQPHCIVESSPDRWHAYWRIADCPPDRFTPLQKALAARFHADSKACDLPRVLRLPGFDHRKGKAYRSRIIELHDALPYTLDEFQRAFAIFPCCATQETQETQDTQVRGERGRAAQISIERFIPTAVGLRNRCLFALARHVKGHKPDATRADLREIVTRWHALASPAIGTTNFSASWGDFMRGWDKVRFAEGAMMGELLRDLDGDPLPDGLPGDYESLTLRLVRICGRLQRKAGKDPFSLSARTAGDLLDVHFTSAANMLHALVVDQVIERVSCGTLKDRRASEYRMPTRGISDGYADR